MVVGHPVADPETGAAHACGHNAQVAGMLGAAMGLLDAGAFEHLAGRVAFIGVPAEEYGDVEWRVAQRDAGRLEFLGGKPEMLRLGHLDDVDMAHDDPRHPAARGGQAGGPDVQQRLRGEDGALRRPRLARGRRPAPGHQRALRGPDRPHGHQRDPGDVPRRGHHPGAPDHHPRRLAGERDPRRGAARDLRAGQVARGHRGRGPQGGPRAAGGGAGARRQAWRSRPCPATCRSAATP